ncbi:MAG: DUF5625 family protein [Deltaproteobacteria bacterium]|nr:DUF5625 family protein [Deltaproteobacteria bacterium]
MKKILIVIMVLFAGITGCRAAGPRPPIELPFAIHQAGASVSTELRIVKEQNYPFMLNFMFEENDNADRERVRKLIGYHGKDRQGHFIEPGIQIPLKITINVIDSVGERLFFEKEVLTMGMHGYGASHFTRKIDSIKLVPGLYRVTVQSLNDVPELVNTIVNLGVYLRESGK